MRTMDALYRHQHPEDCRAANNTFLLVGDYDKGGMGSAMWFWRSCFAYALNSGRIMVPKSKKAKSYFEPWSACSVKDAQAVANTSAHPRAPKPVKPSDTDTRRKAVIRTCDFNFAEFIKDPVWLGKHAPTMFASEGPFWWFMHAAAYLARPSRARLRREVNSLQALSGPERFAALHVRRGDKSRESSPIPVEYFLQELDALLGERGGNLTQALRIVTDEEDEVFAEARNAVPSHQVRYQILPPTKPANVSRFWKAGDDRDITEDLLRLQFAEPLVVAFSSNFGQVAMALKMALDMELRRPGHVVLIDPTFTFNQAMTTVVQPHPEALLGLELQFLTSCRCKQTSQRGCISPLKPYDEMRKSTPPCSKRPVRFSWPRRARSNVTRPIIAG